MIDNTYFQERAIQHDKVYSYEGLFFLHVVGHLAISRYISIKLGEGWVEACILGDKRLFVRFPNFMILFHPRVDVSLSKEGKY